MKTEYKIYLYRGALIDQSCLVGLKVKVLRTSKNPNWGDWLEVVVNKEQFRKIQENLVKHYVGPEPWYTYGNNVENPEDVIVGFGADDGENGKIFEFKKDDEVSYQKMVDYGASKGIPAWVMDFLLINRRKAKKEREERIPQEIKDVGFDFSWSIKKVWKLEVPVEEMNIKDLEWHFEYPFWDKKGTDEYNLTPNEFMSDPQKEPGHLRKVNKADLSYPLDIMWWKNRWLLLDGLHRLVKAKQQGLVKVKVRKIPQEAIPLISKK